MTEKFNKPVFRLTLSAVFVALATALSLIPIYTMPLGGSVTLLSMLPIVMLSYMLGVKWGLGSAFVYSLIQLALGAECFGWGLTPASLIGVICLDYIIPFTALGLAGLAAKKGPRFMVAGTIAVIVLRFISHFLSGYVIFANFKQFVVFGSSFVNRPVLYSICYNGFYMLPELVLTSIAAAVIFNLPQIKKMMK